MDENQDIIILFIALSFYIIYVIYNYYYLPQKELFMNNNSDGVLTQQRTIHILEKSDTIHNVLSGAKKNQYIVLYLYTDSCHYCQEFQPIWKQFANKTMNHNKFKEYPIEFYEHNLQNNTSIELSNYLKDQLKIEGYVPTVYFIRENNASMYVGARDVESLQLQLETFLKPKEKSV